MIAENIIPIRDKQQMMVNKTSWAWSVRAGSASAKAVLLAMTECASSKTLTAFPSVAHICEMTELNRKTVIHALASLITSGLIVDTGKRTGATGQVIIYRVLVGNSPKNGTIEEPQNRDCSKIETVPIFPETVPIFPETVPIFPSNSPKNGTRIPLRNPHRTLNEPLESFVDFPKAPPPAKTADVSPTAPPNRKATNLPDDWSLPADWMQWALTERTDWTDSHAKLTAEIFADYWRSKGGKDARKADWFATWRNWVRRENSLTSKPKPAPAPSKHNGFAQRDYNKGINPDGSF